MLWQLYFLFFSFLFLFLFFLFFSLYFLSIFIYWFIYYSTVERHGQSLGKGLSNLKLLVMTFTTKVREWVNENGEARTPEDVCFIIEFSCDVKSNGYRSLMLFVRHIRPFACNYWMILILLHVVLTMGQQGITSKLWLSSWEREMCTLWKMRCSDIETYIYYLFLFIVVVIIVLEKNKNECSPHQWEKRKYGNNVITTIWVDFVK